MSLDNAVLDRLRRLGGEELIHELARIFLTDAPVRMENARAAFEDADRAAVRREVHALKGSAQNLGASLLTRCAAAAEAVAEAGGATEVELKLDAVERELRRVCAELERMVMPGARPLIAVVEDNADNRLLLRMLLRDRFDLAEYAAGPQALEGMRRRLPTVVLMDIALPGMDGTEVLACMKQDAELHGVPAIALTAHAMPGDRERLLAAGFAEYVTKPILDEADLLCVLERVLEARKAA